LPPTPSQEVDHLLKLYHRRYWDQRIGRRGTEMKTIGVVEKMENITQKEPTTAFPHGIMKNRIETFSPGYFRRR